MSKVFQYCVVGHGLTGTAACKYLAKAGHEVVLVGPSEQNGGKGACYDEGRIYRILDPLESWALLAQMSIERYEDIAAESQEAFFKEAGMLIFGVEDDFVKETREVAAKMRTALLHLAPEDVQARYPWLAVPPETQLGLLQTSRAGHMSPRKLTRAQLKLALRHGAAYKDATVKEISQAEAGHFQVTTTSGEQVLAQNVLVAAGCQTSLLPLLPTRVVMKLTGSQAMLVEVSAATAADLSGMPSMIYEGRAEEDCFYLLPPIQYPDGAWLMKVGPSSAFSPPLHSEAEVDAWFLRGRLDADFEAKAQAFFSALFPHVAVLGRRPLLCVTDETPTRNAYIDLLAPGWGVCTGGNGWAAKSSDEIGLLAAQMMALPGHWSGDPSLPRSWFRAVLPAALQPSPQLQTALASVGAFGRASDTQVVEALEALTALMVVSPRLRRERLAAEVRAALALRWGFAPSVLCSRGGVLAPGHGFVAMKAGQLDVLVVLNS